LPQPCAMKDTFLLRVDHEYGCASVSPRLFGLLAAPRIYTWSGVSIPTAMGTEMGLE
jgi:hypothetical protein